MLRAGKAGIAYKVRRSDRARRVRVTVDGERGVEVVLPPGAGERAAAAAVRELQPWIERRLTELAAVRDAVSSRAGTLPYLGTMLTLVEEPRRQRVHRRGDVLLVPTGAERTPALERWYRRSAYGEISVRLDRACALAGSTYQRLNIRGQRSRWASCSRSGTMSFNWRLLLAPEPVLDYVIWHEVCHLEIMDHSARFWSRLESYCPGYREQVAWLRRHGATLVLG